jgi:hypothetical protein
MKYIDHPAEPSLYTTIMLVPCLYLSSNPVQHKSTKHVENDFHFAQDQVALGEATVLHVPTTSMFTDVFTKGLPSVVFGNFRSGMNILPSDIQPVEGR